MFGFLLAFAISGVPQLMPEGHQIAPTTVNLGHQIIALRAPLVARTPGTQLVLFVRDLSTVVSDQGSRTESFEAAVPTGSISAQLSNEDGVELHLQHTGYVYYKGYSGVVLTESEPGTRTVRYSHLELDASVALPDVRFVWLDQLTRTVRDVPPPR